MAQTWIVSLVQLGCILSMTDVVASGNKTNSRNKSCVSAYPPISPSIISYYCISYQLPSGYCRNIIQWNVYSDKNKQFEDEESLRRYQYGKILLQQIYKLRINPMCSRALDQTLCRRYYPACDMSTPQLLSQPVCRESCEDVMNLCSKEIKIAREANRLIDQIGYPFHWDIVNCSLLPTRNGGEAPECYYRRNLNNETDKLKSKECYYGNGLGYHGNISVTQSGHVCQSWSRQCPHRHRHPLDEYPELINASNYCRNPGGQAPSGPWCYTSDRNKRWEYCNVKKCPDPGPSQAPLLQTAFSTGSNKIFIEWRPVPLPFVHGTPGGFRIRLKRQGADDVIVNITNPNVTQYEAEYLLPLTKYSISILEYNEHDDGVWGRAVTVVTKPEYYVAVRLDFILKQKKFTRALLNRKTPRYKILEKQIKSKINKYLRKTKSEGYNIFNIHIVRFFEGSVGVDLAITAELINVTSWAVTQSIVGKIKQAEKSRSKRSLEFTSLRAKASPPPPKNLTQSDVTNSSVLLNWSAPDYNGPFNITNYTIQYKKSGTTMKYYDAVVVSGNTSLNRIGNLDVGTKYLMRVESANDYGIQPGEAITVTTLPANPSKTNTATNAAGPSIASIAAPLGVMAAVLLVIGVVFLRWWRNKQQNEQELRDKIERLRKDPYESSVDWFKLFKIDVVQVWWEIPRGDLTVEHQVGEGAFGVVNKGFVKKVDDDGREHGQHCAIKALKEYPTVRQLFDFCKEIKTMSSIEDHPNIVSLIGACTINGPPWLVVKFAPNGCLLDYIKENRPLPNYENTVNEPPHRVITEKERFKFAYEIAQGMAHLEKYRFVHRDLAARNILLGRNMVAMVSDFGLSRDIYEFGVYEHTEGGVLPVRWMSPESLTCFTYNSKTDVWSYGVLLWEMETGGDLPYGGLQGLEILKYLKQGNRLDKPRDTSRDMYSLMWKCWHPDPKERPTFSDLVYQVGGLYTLAGGEEDEVNINGAFVNQGLEQEQQQTNNNTEHFKPMNIPLQQIVL